MDVTFLRPVTKEEARLINMNKEERYWTICEVLRTIHKLASHIDDKRGEEIMEKCRIAVVLAKRMNLKLREYKKDYDKGWWPKKNGSINIDTGEERDVPQDDD